MKKLGVIEKHWKLSPRAGDWPRVKNKAWEARCMEVYAAMVDSMDQGIGRIAAALKETGQFANTLIFFLQDNGGCAEGLGRGARGKYTTRPDKPPFQPMAPGALQKGMIPRQTRDGWPTIMGPGVMPGPDGTYIAYGRAWANVSNTPFREYKHWVHEGGIATPLIVHWPAGIKAAGALRHQPGHLIDIMSTCVDVAGATYPAQYKGSKIKPMEGKSLAAAFDDKPIKREALYWEHEGNRAVRVGKYKLVAKGRGGRWELYDMQADRTELNDLAAKMPQKAKELAEMWQKYAERADVLPWPGGRRRKKDKAPKK
jgi:arylsulfatase